MVSKIHKSASLMASVIDYNEKKVAAGTADRLLVEGFVRNYDAVPKENIPAKLKKDFFVREIANIRTKNVSFHLTIDPGEFDKELSDEEVKALARDLLQGLGYGEQPWVLYKHHDIDRIHYHIVSTTIKEDGTRIKGSNERFTLQQLLKDNAQKYGYWLGRVPRAVKAKSFKENDSVPIFSQGKKNVSSVMREALLDSLAYGFTSMPQWYSVCEAHGLAVNEYAGEDGTKKMAFKGIGRDGKPCTPAVPAEELVGDLMKKVSDAVASNAGSERLSAAATKRSRKEIASTVERFLQSSRSESQFLSACAAQGVGVVLHRSEESGDIYGVTLIDHVDKLVFKASDVSRDLGPQLREASSRWEENTNAFREKKDKERAAANRAGKEFFLHDHESFPSAKERRRQARLAKAVAREALRGFAGTVAATIKKEKTK